MDKKRKKKKRQWHKQRAQGIRSSMGKKNLGTFPYMPTVFIFKQTLLFFCPANSKNVHMAQNIFNIAKGTFLPAVFQILTCKSVKKIIFSFMILQISNVATFTGLPNKLHSHPFATKYSVCRRYLDRKIVCFHHPTSQCSHEKMNADVYRCILYPKDI